MYVGRQISRAIAFARGCKISIPTEVSETFALSLRPWIKKALFSAVGFEFSNRSNYRDYSGTSIPHLESYSLFKEKKKSFPESIQTLQTWKKLFDVEFLFIPLCTSVHFAARLDMVHIFDVWLITFLIFLVEGKEKINFSL